MGLLKVSSGAASIELEYLTNANFSGMRLSRVAAGYELDFGSTLLQYPAKDATPPQGDASGTALSVTSRTLCSPLYAL
jgi:hypothetical protein